MSADSGSVVNDGGSHLFSQIFEVVDTERFDVLWWVNINEFHLIFPQKIEPSQKDSVFPYVEGALSLKKDTEIRRVYYGMKQAGVLGKVGGNMSIRPRLTMKEEDRG